MSPAHRTMYPDEPFLDDNDHKEKPSQRVVYPVPSPYLVLLLAYYLLAAYCTQLVEDHMPTVVKEMDIAQIPKPESEVFSEESAKKFLMDIIGDQPRVAGTKYHLEKTQDLKKLVDNIAAQSHLPVKTDWQFASGDYWLAFSSPHVNLYQNLSNIIAVLEGESGFHSNGSTGSSLLLNCHYDSVPFAIGASDNGIFCAVMAEVLSKLSRRTKKFKHNIIFLFNGAEEAPLHGSHAFLSHLWSKGVTSVINLDSAGTNGLPSLFQVTDPRVLAAYKRTNSRPSAQSMGEALFRSGVIPSDTDFRIFRDFGHIQGGDIAFNKYGVVYHTRNDEPSLIREGVVQGAGDMLLALARDLADEDDLAATLPPTQMVYYDYLTVLLVTYAPSTALVVDLVVVLLALTSVFYYLWIVGLRWSSVRDLLWSLVERLLCALCGLLAVALATAVMAVATTQLRYLSRPWLVVPLYWLPFFIVAVFMSHELDDHACGLTRPLRAARAASSARLLLAAVLLVMCALKLYAASYLISVPLALSSLADLINLTALRLWRPAAWRQLLLCALLALPALLLACCAALRVSAVLLPVGGRSGAACPDCSIAAVSVVLAMLVAAILSGIELLFSRKHLWLVLGALSAICVAVMFAPFSPYDEDGIVTQRHYWFHTQITTYSQNLTVLNETSGVLVTKVDVYSVRAAEEALAEYSSRKIVQADCERAVYCGLPLYRPRFEAFLSGSLLVDFPPPQHFPHELRLQRRACEGGSCKLDFVMTGPAHNTITVWPRADVSLRAWSLSSELTRTAERLGRPVFVVSHAADTYHTHFPPFYFSLTFDVPAGQTALAEVSHHAHQVHHPEAFSAAYRGLLASVPKHFNVASFLSFRSDYVF